MRQFAAPNPSTISTLQTVLTTTQALQPQARRDAALCATVRTSRHDRALRLRLRLPAQPANNLRTILYLGKRGDQPPQLLNWKARRLNRMALSEHTAMTSGNPGALTIEAAVGD